MYAMYVNVGYVHRLAERWRANVNVFSNLDTTKTIVVECGLR